VSGSSCKDGVAQAALPLQPVSRASVGPGFLAWLIVSKYGDHLPLCRLERIFARHGSNVTRARMSDWLMTLADLAQPLIRAVMKKARDGGLIQADETSLRMLLRRRVSKSRCPHNQSNRAFGMMLKMLNALGKKGFGVQAGQADVRAGEKTPGAFLRVLAADRL
jgi:hypothetical protein